MDSRSLDDLSSSSCRSLPTPPLNHHHGWGIILSHNGHVMSTQSFTSPPTSFCFYLYANGIKFLLLFAFRQLSQRSPQCINQLKALAKVLLIDQMSHFFLLAHPVRSFFLVVIWILLENVAHQEVHTQAIFFCDQNWLLVCKWEIPAASEKKRTGSWEKRVLSKDYGKKYISVIKICGVGSHRWLNDIWRPFGGRSRCDTRCTNHPSSSSDWKSICRIPDHVKEGGIICNFHPLHYMNLTALHTMG